MDRQSVELMLKDLINAKNQINILKSALKTEMERLDADSASRELLMDEDKSISHYIDSVKIRDNNLLFNKLSRYLELVEKIEYYIN